jgi:hypothetical protein
MPTEDLTPEQHAKAWISMGAAGDRDRVMKAIDEIEQLVDGLRKSWEYALNRDQWEDFGYQHDDPLKYVQDHLSDSDEAPVILARLRDLRELLNRILPPGQT